MADVNHKLLWNLWLAPWVIAMRMPILMAEQLQPAHRRPETNRAVNEKLRAGSGGMIDASVDFWMRAAFMPLELAKGQSPATIASNAMQRYASVGAAQAARTVGANHRRLSKRTTLRSRGS